MNNKSFKFRRSLSFILSICLTFSGFPIQDAFAEAEAVNAVSGSGGSISIFLTDGAGNPISSTIHAGDVVCPKASAHTPTGDTIPCKKPSFGKIDGFTGNQLGDLNPNGCFVAGRNMGSAEITVSCDELPNVQGKMEVSNVGGLMTPAQKAAEQAAAEQAAAEAASGMSGAQAALLGAGLGLGVVGLVVAATSSSANKSCPCSGQYYVNGRCQTCPQANNSCYGAPSPGYKYCP